MAIRNIIAQEASQHCLSLIPGRCIVDAIDRLPACGPDSTVEEVAVDVAGWGRFRLCFRPLQLTVPRRERRWFWIASGAERLEAQR